MVPDPARRARAIFDEPVAVRVAELVDPPERGVDVRSQSADELDVTRPPEVLREQDQEPRRRVDRAEVRRVRDDSGAREVAPADLVQDLAGLFIAPVVDLGPL